MNRVTTAVKTDVTPQDIISGGNNKTHIGWAGSIIGLCGRKVEVIDLGSWKGKALSNVCGVCDMLGHRLLNNA